MARPVDAVTSSDIDVIRFDDLSFEGRYGRVGVTLYLPSVRSVGIHGWPDVVVPYSAGWGEGSGAAALACEALTRTINAMTVAVDYPRRHLGVADILPFRTEVLGEVVTHVKENTHYDDADIVLMGYSRGTGPARLAALECVDYVDGLSLIAPTWFPVAVSPHELARRGLAESARGIARGDLIDRLSLITATARVAQEMLAHPLALRNDIAAISSEGVADLEEVLDTGIKVSVTAGTYDELCPVDGIRGVIEGLPEGYYVDYREVPSDHFSYFFSPKPLRVVSEQIAALAAGQLGLTRAPGPAELTSPTRGAGSSRTTGSTRTTDSARRGGTTEKISSARKTGSSRAAGSTRATSSTRRGGSTGQTGTTAQTAG